jgi:hypothetical protein
MTVALVKHGAVQGVSTNMVLVLLTTHLVEILENMGVNLIRFPTKDDADA